MNLYIISFKVMIKNNSFSLYLFYFGTLFVLHLLFYPIFMAFPEPFYYRPWEYFDELAYKNNKYATKWQGKEYGDLTRGNYFCRQESYETSVTTDKDGFRSVPFDNSDAKILFSGDSQIFGSSLSDQDTLPWTFSELTGIPVFNGSRTSLANIIKKPGLDQVKIIIDGMTERNIMPQSFFL